MQIISFYHACIDRCKLRMLNETRTWKLKLEIKDLLFIAFQQKKPQSLHKFCWVLVCSVLLVTYFSGNSWNAWWDWHHVRASSWCHISTLVIVSFPLFINSEELIYFQISEVSCSISQTQIIITFTIEVCIAISGITFEWGMLFRSEIQWFYWDFTR